MNYKKILGCALAIALALPMAAVPATAAQTTFPDITEHWAKESIEKMTTVGMFKGYEDGSFRPDEIMTGGTALALCARVAVDAETRAQIGADRKAQITDLFGKNQEWFHNEYATCLELGILTYEELEDYYDQGLLEKSMNKGEFSRYLVRAMGLADLALSLTTYPLDFEDKSDIAEELQPYVYVLTSYGVINGDQNNNFMSKISINRAMAATMLSRALEQVTSRGIANELPQYTKGKWVSGYIQNVDVASEGALTVVLKSDLSGTQTVTMPTTALIYQYNMPVERTALRVGTYARMNYTPDGKTIQSVRLISAAALEKNSGKVDEISPDVVLLDGTAYAINRFTEVSAGGKVGDRTIIDYQAEYTTAVAVVDYSGKVVSLALEGGTREVEGILKDVTISTVGATTKTIITVTSYNGSNQTYTVADTVVISADGIPATMKESFEGRRIAMRVDNGDVTKIAAIDVDMLSKYVQGIIRSVSTKNQVTTINMTLTGAAKQTVYELATDCTVQFMGAVGTVAQMKEGYFATAKVEGGMIQVISAWQGYAYTEGVITSIAYGDPTVLTVTQEDGTVTTFSIALENVNGLAIQRDDTSVGISGLKTGDTATVTVLYNQVTQIDAVSRAANISGVVRSITFTDQGADITVAIGDGTTVSYTATSATTVTQSSKVVALNSIRVGNTLALVTNGTQAVSIQIAEAAAASNELSGTIFTVESGTRSITLLVTNSLGKQELVKVNIPSNVVILDTSTGNSFTGTSKLAAGNTLKIWGNYNGSDFTATAVVRVS